MSIIKIDLVALRDHLLASHSNELERRLDEFARTREYKNIESAISYAVSSVPSFAAEGKRALHLRDTTWLQAIKIYDDVVAGRRPAPTFAELVAELPALTWE